MTTDGVLSLRFDPDDAASHRRRRRGHARGR